MCIYNGRADIDSPIAIFIIGESIRFDDGELHRELLGIEINKWRHIVITRDSNNIKIYLNGKLRRTTSSTSFTSNKITYASIGCSSENTNTPRDKALNGDLNDFRIYGTALSEDDIKELYNVPTSLDNNGNIFTGELIEED